MRDTKFFIEIGSCNFGTLNHLASHGWEGIIVEPIAKYLNDIERMPGVQYVNKAIDTTSSKRTMFVYKDDICKNDRDFSGMSCFEEYVIGSNSAFIDTVDVLNRTYDALMLECHVKRIDFLKIDTEGHDWAILQMVNYEGALRPQIIKAETKHLGANKELAVKFLEDRHYLVYQERDDLYAINIKL